MRMFCVVRGRSAPFYNAGIAGRDKRTTSSVDIAVLTLERVSDVFRVREVTEVDVTCFSLMSRLLVPAGPIGNRTVAPAAGDRRCQADRGKIVGQVSNPSPSCGTIRVRYRPRRAGR
jgi:hypothetical protein